MEEDVRRKFRCTHAGCNHAYLRSEHLNRHSLTHKKATFLCHRCHRRFTRNDLLQAHLRRHEKQVRSKDIQPASASSSRSPAESSHGVETYLSQSTRSPEVPFGGFSGQRQLGQLDPSMSRVQDFHELSKDLPSQMAEISMSPPFNEGVQPIPQTFFPDPQPAEDFTWLFGEESLYDHLSDHYLQFYFDDFVESSLPDNGIPSREEPRNCHEIKFDEMCYQMLVVEFPEILTSSLDDLSTTIQVLQSALDYCRIYMPLFHEPTFSIETSPTLLILSLCCLGIFLGSHNATLETGILLQKHIWRKVTEIALSKPKAELWVLQTLILVVHVSTYALTRSEHEMAEIGHSIILARRNSFMADVQRAENTSQQSLDEKWREWAHKESIIRLAHVIFVNDVQSMIHFTHPTAIPVGMMRVPLPSSLVLWEASTAAQWEIEMRHAKKGRSKYASMKSCIEAWTSIREPDIKRLYLQRFDHSNSISLNILVHGIISAIADDKYRTVLSASSSTTRIIKAQDFSGALARWKSSFDRMDEIDQRSHISWCSLIAYHFAAIILRNNIADIQVAAGSDFSFGRFVTPQRAQESYIRLVTTGSVSLETYLHGLEIVRLCLQKPETGIGSVSHPMPLWHAYCAFLGILAVWAYIIGLENSKNGRVYTMNSVLQPPFPALPVLQPPPPSMTTEPLQGSGDDVANKTLTGLFQHAWGRSNAEVQEAKSIREHLCTLIDVVYDLLGDCAWDISHEARRILKSLKEREQTTIS